jgi:uncharacterized protein YaiL (DUF2058 family)
MSVSAPTGSNIDLDAIVAGGAGFAERMEKFQAAAKEAREVKTSAAALMARAKEAQAKADKQLAELAVAQTQANEAKAKFEGLYEEIQAIARGDR